MTRISGTKQSPNDCKLYEAAEDAARAGKRGLWRDADPVPLMNRQLNRVLENVTSMKPIPSATPYPIQQENIGQPNPLAPGYVGTYSPSPPYTKLEHQQARISCDGGHQ
jgi:hypothetical protein